MKTRFTNVDAVRTFLAQSQDYGTNAGGSFYFRDSVAYSYGDHYPLARFLSCGTLLISERDSSPTTNKLNTLLRREARCEIIEVQDVLADTRDDRGANMDRLNALAEQSKAKASRSRKYAELHLNDASRYYNMLTRYMELTVPDAIAA